ncbi:MAG TPA: hypothetical protein VFC96_04870 [Anaerovoracaceae bacterium]|nr:hypothetical protein [Anaerovoracaceae bacterium]
MNEELKQAVENLKHEYALYILANSDFEEVAWHKWQAAEARVDTLIREKKEVFVK